MRNRHKGIPTEFDLYTLTAKGEVLGHVEVPAGARPGERFHGYFHPARAFSRVVGLFDAFHRALRDLDRVADSERAATASTEPGAQPWPVESAAMTDARKAVDKASEAFHALGLALRDARDGPVKSGFIWIERVRIEEEHALFEKRVHARSPFDEIDAGVEVSPYRLFATSPQATRARRGETPSEPWGDAWMRLDATDDDDDNDDAAHEKDGPDDEYAGGAPVPDLRDRLALWQRAASGRYRETFYSVLERASPSDDDFEDRDLWVTSVQVARERGMLDPERSEYLIWSIVTRHEENSIHEEDPVLVDLIAREDALAAELQLADVEEFEDMANPPAEWLAMNEDYRDRRAQLVSEAFISVGEPSIETALRERPEQFAARMAVWEEQVKREHAEARER